MKSLWLLQTERNEHPLFLHVMEESFLQSSSAITEMFLFWKFSVIFSKEILHTVHIETNRVARRVLRDAGKDITEK